MPRHSAELATSWGVFLNLFCRCTSAPSRISVSKTRCDEKNEIHRKCDVGILPSSIRRHRNAAKLDAAATSTTATYMVHATFARGKPRTPHARETAVQERTTICYTDAPIVRAGGFTWCFFPSVLLPPVFLKRADTHLLKCRFCIPDRMPNRMMIGGRILIWYISQEQNT